MLFLCKFLYRNLKGYRLLAVLAMLMTCAQVSSDLLATIPLKFIVSKISNPRSDPSCTFPFLDSLLTVFDTPVLDPSFPPIHPNQPPLASCPSISSGMNSVIHPRLPPHPVTRAITFSL